MMTFLRSRFPCLVSLVLAAGLVAACDSGTAAEVELRPAAQFRAIPVADSAPPLAQTEVSFWARYDEDREVTIWFRSRPGATDSTAFLEFEVDEGSLVAYPDGRRFSGSDSVLITIRVPDPRRYYAEFEPSGLRFNPLKPAELEFELFERDDDVNEDGDVDDDDRAAQSLLRIWKQERPFDPWLRLDGTIRLSDDELEVDVISFTGYAVAI